MADIQNVQKLRAMYADVSDNVNAIKGSIQQVTSQQDSLTEEKNAIEDAVMNELTKKMRCYLYGKAAGFEYTYLDYKGIWKSGESYVVDDLTVIVDSSNGAQYVCILNHTSADGNKPGTAGGASYWDDAPALVSTQVVFGGTYGNVNLLAAIYDWIIQEQLMSSMSFPLPPVPYWSDIYIYEGIGWDDDENIQGYVDDWSFSHDYLNQPLGNGSNPSTYGINPNIDALEGAKEILTNNSDKIKDSKAVFGKYIQP